MDQNTLQITPEAEGALNQLQDTNLTGMEEALFQAWTKANQIEEPDDPKDTIDYRGIWKSTNGRVLPFGELKKMADNYNNAHTLEQALHQRMMARISEVTGKQEDFAKSQFDAERTDIEHGQKMEQGKLKLKQAPFDLKMKQHDIEGKKIDIEGKKLGLESQELGNKGKEIDLIASLMQPAPAMQQISSPKPKSTGSK